MKSRLEYISAGKSGNYSSSSSRALVLDKTDERELQHALPKTTDPHVQTPGNFSPVPEYLFPEKSQNILTESMSEMAQTKYTSPSLGTTSLTP
ncbi:hypothetical protein PIB30_040356 [Stylosanthes scabra]|uniref:Uncharacterized protein n=1 Tax=Stylosanthes scabra TaxID=79078 RepID=A0ABU6WD55_9FABA|nr:hypothetical protein [Stylosanthes scabra]